MNTRRVSLITFAFALLACTELPIAGDSRATPDLSSQRAPYNMPTSISPASPPTISMTIPIPNGGESANHLSLKQFVQPLTDDAEAFRLLTYGGGIRRRVTCTDNTTMTIQPLGAVVVRNGLGEWTVLQHSVPSTVSPTAISGGLNPSTRYWVYAYLNGGSLDFVAGTVNPDSGLRYQNGDEKFLYVSTFYTNSSSNVLRYSQNDSVYRYFDMTVGGSGTDGNLILDGGNATSFTTVLFGDELPVQANEVALLSAMTNISANGEAFVATDTTFGTSYVLLTLRSATASTNQLFGHAALSKLEPNIRYSVNAANTLLSIWVAGFSL